MKIVAPIAALLSGCATLSNPTAVEVDVVVTSYDPTQETYTAIVRNSSDYSVLVLHPLAILSETPEPNVADRPAFGGDFVPMFHDNRLLPGESLEFKGTCGLSDSEREKPRYVGFYVCRYNRGWDCPKYLVKWSKKPVKNAT